MRLSLRAGRIGMRVAYAGLRTYWFLARPQIVGVKCIVTDGDTVLLVRHTYGAREWDLPGGTVRRREVPRDAARREMSEELGRRFDDWVDLGELYISSNHHHDNLHLFHTRVSDRALDLNLVELAEADWFARDALPADVSRYVMPILSRVTTAA
jgi:8-oxo-dGTP pyrophosphatase MutT (NUDIX family)